MLSYIVYMSDTTPRGTALLSLVRARGAAFLFVFFLTYTLTLIVLLSVGMVPTVASTGSSVEPAVEDAVDEEVLPEPAPVIEEPASDEVVSEDPSLVTNSELPLTLTIDALDRELSIQNPTSRAIADLDAALLEGVVRHPDSASLGEGGTVFILGHSSYLPIVRNKNYQAFNGLQNLSEGDVITRIPLIVSTRPRLRMYQYQSKTRVSVSYLLRVIVLVPKMIDLSSKRLCLYELRSKIISYVCLPFVHPCLTSSRATP
jgi:sortase (surface protein transpeptidase)